MDKGQTDEDIYAIGDSRVPDAPSSNVPNRYQLMAFKVVELFDGEDLGTISTVLNCWVPGILRNSSVFRVASEEHQAERRAQGLTPQIATPEPLNEFDQALADMVTDEAKKDPDWLAKARTGRIAINDSPAIG